MYPAKDGSVGGDRDAAPDLRLDCDTGFGTASFVTGAFGLVAASRIIQRIVQPPDGLNPKSESRNPTRPAATGAKRGECDGATARREEIRSP